jgi:hypothetical protein
VKLSSDALLLLDRIEAVEARSLSWGFTSGSLSEQEVCALLEDQGRAEDALEDLIDARLVGEYTSLNGSRCYRSRMAESVRLLAANRQQFSGKPWQGAPSLVADFRIDRRRRRFPKRDRRPDEVLSEQGQQITRTGLRQAIWNALTRKATQGLAGFQVRATLRICRQGADEGTIVTAGTGSGKTMAFYIPAMLSIGDAIDGSRWVKALAIYPRTELLKDQFAEAFRMARAIDDPLAAHGKRPLVIGALFASTPTVATDDELSNRKWTRRGRDWVCPWMRCQCGADMLWRASDISAQRERLACARSDCDGRTSETQVVLTRRSMQTSPPDILFTTTEILNQRMSDHWMRSLFGIGSHLKPFFALLDEVHTYSGTGGAQAALTLRRWRHLLAAPLHWVGLSATLDDAARFFADLTGASKDRVAEITPSSNEFEESGAEYQLALRGDPASRASLLSTTIQTAMLVSRVLDPPGARDTSGAFGRRAFLFTDDLDVANRLFDNLRDAEAYDKFGRPDPQRLPLAALRGATSDARSRDLEGQRWRLCEDVGHPLNQRLIVGRTTSQTAGVLQNANIIVATAALEVGFNDPFVGAVIQHKAPRGMASFVQRKGRAGRDRAMRPMTITVLSDYGRDRALYQSFERLFDPQIDPQYLPIGNPYVLKMQATFALFDWLAAETAGFEKAWAWEVLSGPDSNRSAPKKAVLVRIKDKLTDIVRGDEAALSSLRQHVMGALCVDESTVQGLLWGAPRSLLLEVVPTLTRRLYTDWKLAFPSAAGSLDRHVPYHPMPDFVPRNLFSELSLPEVGIEVPPATVNDEWRTEYLPVLQALRQLTPGRVTRRFAFERGGLSHWVAVDHHLPVQTRRIGDYAEQHEFVGQFTATMNEVGDEGPVPVYRPWSVRLEKIPAEIVPSSNAHLTWRTDILALGEPVNVAVSPRSVWKPYVSNIDFYLHRFRASAAVRRFATKSEASILTKRDEFRVVTHFVSDEDRTAAVGFEIEVDGFCLDVNLSSLGQGSANRLSPQVMRDSKLAYLRQCFLTDDSLPTEINVFQRDWLFQMLMAVLASEVARGRALDDIARRLALDSELDTALQDVMHSYFGDVPITWSDDDDLDLEDDSSASVDGPEASQDPPGHQSVPRLQRALVSHLARAEVRGGLRAIIQEMLTLNTRRFELWLGRLVLDSLGEAMLQACIAAAPRHATSDNLLVDIKERPPGESSSIWITETTLGGAGVLQAFAERFASEPNCFFDAVEAALAPTDFELVDGALKRILYLSRIDPVVRDGLDRLRTTESHAASVEVWRELSLALTRHGGIDLSHALLVVLNSRLLRPGATASLNELLGDLSSNWDALEIRLGVAIGLREFAYAVAKDSVWGDRVRSHLVSNLPAPAAANVSVFAAIFGMMWQRASEVRRASLSAYNPYRGARATDPAVVRELLLQRTICIVDLSEPDWQAAAAAALAAEGTCRLRASPGQTRELRAALVHLAATPVDVGVLQFYPVIERIQRGENSILVDLLLREHA